MKEQDTYGGNMRKRMLLLTKGNHWGATLLTNYSSEKERERKKEREVLLKTAKTDSILWPFIQNCRLFFEVAMAGAVITSVSSVEQETKQSRPYRQCTQGSRSVCVCGGGGAN